MPGDTDASKTNHVNGTKGPRHGTSVQRHGHLWHPSPFNERMWQTQVTLLPTMQQTLTKQSRADDIELCVEVGGNPNHPPLVLAMGLGSHLIFWPEDFVDRLIDANFYVIRFDNRDIGLSSKIIKQDSPAINTAAAMLKFQLGMTNPAPIPYGLIDMADDMACLLTTLDLDPVAVVGASMGGMIAQILTARYPHLVERLVLLFTSNNRPLLPPTKPRQLCTLIKKPAGQSKQDIVRHSAWFVDTIGSPGYKDLADIKRLAALRYDRCFHPLGTFQQLNAILLTGSIREYSKAIHVPTLVLHGSKDGLVPTSHGRHLAKDIPNAKFVLVDGMAHDLPKYFRPFLVEQIKEHLQPMLDKHMTSI